VRGLFFVLGMRVRARARREKEPSPRAILAAQNAIKRQGADLNFDGIIGLSLAS
jgi:hypothetical protein